MVPPFEVLPLAELRGRSSIKWRMYDPDVLPLWVAEMDALPAPAVTAAVTRAMATGDTGYPAAGTAYAEALAEHAQRRWGWEVDVEATAVAADVINAMRYLIEALTEPGDGVLVPVPVYGPFFMVVEELGRRVVPVPLTAEHRLDLAAMATALETGDVRAVLLCSPHNPTGTVHTAAELSAVASLADAQAVPVVVDEIHGSLAPVGFTPYLSVSETGFVVTSASKAFNLAGLKAGVIVAGPRSRETLERLPVSVHYGASHLGVQAHIAAWREGDEWLDAVNANIAANVLLLGDLLAEHLPAVRWTPPEATYLAWLDCTALGLGDDPAEAFLERGRVALSSGPTFGVGGAGHARLNLAASRATLQEAVLRMAGTAASA